jgi:charged multivesicular body protein 7
LKQRSDTLAQLEEVLAGIEQASDQAEIVTVLEGSRDVLRALNKQVGGVERVEDVLEDLREEMGKTDEVGAVIREGATVGIDEDEIDEELAAMEVDGRREREEQAVEERKAREGKEAEETRKQLAEIEKEKMYETVEPGESEPRMDGSVGNTNAPQETKVSSTTESYANIEDSMKRLSQMSIEDFEPPKGLVPSREQLHQEPFQAIPAD